MSVTKRILINKSLTKVTLKNASNIISLKPIIYQVFDRNWHKIHFGVSRERALLYVDCQNKSSQDFLQPRGPIDINGDISISKLIDSRETVPVSY